MKKHRSAAASGGVKVRRDPNFNKLTESSKVPTKATSELDNVPRDPSPARWMMAEVAQQAEEVHLQRTQTASEDIREKIDRDKAQNIGAAGLVGVQQDETRPLRKTAARQQERSASRESPRTEGLKPIQARKWL